MESAKEVELGSPVAKQKVAVKTSRRHGGHLEVKRSKVSLLSKQVFYFCLQMELK